MHSPLSSYQLTLEASGSQQQPIASREQPADREWRAAIASCEQLWQWHLRQPAQQSLDKTAARAHCPPPSGTASSGTASFLSHLVEDIVLAKVGNVGHDFVAHLLREVAKLARRIEIAAVGKHQLGLGRVRFAELGLLERARAI